MPKKTVLKLMAASDNLWAMQPGAFSAFMDALQMEAKSPFEGPGDASPYQLESGVAIIPVDGVILRQQFWGFGAGLREINAALSAALADHEVRAILFNICSPGGQARGVKELADAIFAARAIKPCAAWVDGLCASAAYWLASATGRIYAGPSSEVGSIGVILRHMDMSGFNKEMGLNFTYITAGSHKAIGNPDTALSERDLAVLQARVNEIYEMFCSDVASHMGLALDNRLSWADGRDFLAGEAEALGLITSLVPNREEAVRNLLKETFMDKTELAQKHPELLTSIEADAKQAALQEASKKNEAAVNEAVANTLAIMETACGKEATDKVRALVATGMTPAQLEAAAKAFGSCQHPQDAPSNAGADAHKQMLEAIKQATPGAVSATAPAEDEAAAFIQRVGAM
jgi:signal peptide peptidase SppA